MFPVSVPRTFEITGAAPVIELLFRKVIDIFVFRISFENSVTCTGIIQKVAPKEMFEKFPFNQNCGLQSPGHKATVIGLLINFFKVFWKFWKYPAVTSAVEFLFTKEGSL